jgi:hypothetical protein
MQIAVAFLTRKVSDLDIGIIKEISRFYDTFVVSDEYNYHKHDYYSIVKEDGLNVVYVSEDACIESGFHSSNVTGTHIKKRIVALDKALYHFSLHDYDFTILIEDDVFIPSLSAFLLFVTNNYKYDLAIPFHIKKTDKILDWHWSHVVDKIDPPYFYSMACVVGISKSMMSCIKDYVGKNKTLIYLEVMFNTIADHNNLKINTPKELKSIIFNGFWAENDFILKPNNFFHPVKNTSKYSYYRRVVKEYNNVFCIPCSMQYFFPIKFQNRLIRLR